MRCPGAAMRAGFRPPPRWRPAGKRDRPARLRAQTSPGRIFAPTLVSPVTGPAIRRISAKCGLLRQPGFCSITPDNAHLSRISTGPSEPVQDRATGPPVPRRQPAKSRDQRAPPAAPLPLPPQTTPRFRGETSAISPAAPEFPASGFPSGRCSAPPLRAAGYEPCRRWPGGW